MRDENPIRTLRDYSRPSHEGYRNTIELLEGNSVVPLRSDTIRLVQNGCSFFGLWRVMELYNKYGRSQPVKVVGRYWERHRCPVVGRVVVAAVVVKVEAGKAHFSANVEFAYLSVVDIFEVTAEISDKLLYFLESSTSCSGLASQPAIAAVTTRITGEDINVSKYKDANEIIIEFRIDQGVGSTSGIRACALRNFDLEVMELENSQNNALAKLPMLKLGEYEMWEIRIKQYFQIQDYALWEVIENGNSWVPIPVTQSESGPSTALKMTVPSTSEEKTCKKNDVKARSLLLMALPNEHQLTFDQYVDAQSMFAAIKARFGGNEATKKIQKALLKQYRLAILGVVTSPKDLNVKFLRSLLAEWDTHVVVWMNNPDFDTMGLDDLYNNFKIVEQKVKKSAGASNDDKNLAFLTTSGASSTNNINTAIPEVSTATTKVNTASIDISTASFSDATWNMALLSMRARKFYQRTGRKIVIDGSNTAGYDKSKVECFNCHKLGHFTRECRAPRNKDIRNWNQGRSSKTIKIEDASEKAMCAIDGAGFDWSDMAEEEIQANMALMAFTDSEVKNDKSCSKTCLKNYEDLKKQYDDLLVKLDDTGFKAATYKRESDNSKDNTDDSLTQQPKIVTETSFVMSPLKLDKDWKEKFFHPTNHIRVSDDEEEVEPISKVEKKTAIPTATKNDRQLFSTVAFNTVRPSYTVHPKSTVPCARPKTHFQNQAQSTVQRPFYKSTALTKRSNNQNINTGRQTVNTVRPNVNTSNSQLNGKGFMDSGCSRHMSRNIAHLSDFKDFNGGYVTFGRGANGGRITGKGIKREYSVARTPQQNGVAERKNRTLIEAARTMLADSKLPTTFWAEAVSTACYVQNRVLIVKPHNKTPYELFRGIKPAIGFMKPFGCHVTILNTLDKLGKFDGKSDEGFFVGYSLSSKAFRVYNIRTRKVQENLHVGFLENKPMLEGNGPKWLFDLDSLTQSMNYVPVVAGTFSNVSAGIQGVSESSTSSQQDQDCIVMPIWKDASYFDDSSLKSGDDAQLQDQDGTHDDCSLQDNGTDDQQVNATSPEVNIDLMGPIPTTEDTQVEDQEIELGNLSPSYAVSSTPHTRIHKDHPIDHVIGDEELLQFKLQNVWVLVDLPKGHRAIGTKSFIEAIEYSWLMLLFRVLQSTNGCQGGSYMVKLKGGYDIIFGSTKKELCDEFKKLMKDKFQMSSMGELTFFLGLQVQQRKKASLFSHDKLSMKFEKVSNTRCEHLVPDIRYLKGKPSLGLWYSKDSSLELIAYTDSGVVELTLDRWSTIEVVMFLGKIDLLTKGFDAGRFQYLVSSIGMLNP
ncbi:putative ribonuclease H-like domain-containing protein [Tanacetum coccineum]|uniref:Ribonuclease H-like domain-containing protein n=1 Tax=Tanacetum coccineum TaxID=301880 RepID=A0ABQ5BBR2_9ASTR